MFLPAQPIVHQNLLAPKGSQMGNTSHSTFVHMKVHYSPSWQCSSVSCTFFIYYIFMSVAVKVCFSALQSIWWCQINFTKPVFFYQLYIATAVHLQKTFVFCTHIIVFTHTFTPMIYWGIWGVQCFTQGHIQMWTRGATAQTNNLMIIAKPAFFLELPQGHVILSIAFDIKCF